jgi:hypothetical protein
MRPFRIFSKIRGDIRSSRFATGVKDTGWQMEKIFNQKNYNNFVWSPLGSRGNIYINFCLPVHFQLSAAWYCSHYLPPVSTTQGALVAKFAAGVVDTGGKFGAGVIWYRRQFATGSKFATGVVDTAVHLDLRISPRIFEKIRNDPNVIIRGSGEGDSWKKPEAKNLVTLSLYLSGTFRWVLMFVARCHFRVQNSLDFQGPPLLHQNHNVSRHINGKIH